MSAAGFGAPEREPLQLEVTDVTAEARDVLLIELRRPRAGDLPAFEPGAHLEIALPNGLIRHYSIASDPRERDRYLVGVGRAAQSRGGSVYVHQALRKGDLLTVRVRNHFRLLSEPQRFLFIAGGIGITPIMSMIHWCEAHSRQWRLVFATRSAQRAAFLETLRGYGERVHLHFDDERAAVLDVQPWIDSVRGGEHVYCCGPQALMDAVHQSAAQLPAEQLHFEYFAAPAGAKDAAATLTGAYEVTLQKSGKTFVVTPDRSLLDALEAQGLSVPFSCREGMCGTCETGVCAGDVDHRDYVLSPEQRAASKSMMVCVSHAKSPHLVLDL